MELIAKRLVYVYAFRLEFSLPEVENINFSCTHELAEGLCDQRPSGTKTEETTLKKSRNLQINLHFNIDDYKY